MSFLTVFAAFERNTEDVMLLPTLIVCLALARSTATQHREQEFSLAMTDMVVNAEWIYEDCPNSVISDVEFDIGYAHGKRTTCRHNADPIMPVELSGGVEALVMFGEEASEHYAASLLNRTLRKVNMTRWRQLALEQLKACDVCLNEEGDDCIRWFTATNRTSVRDIVRTVYLVTKYTCYIRGPNREFVIAPVITGNTANTSLVNISRADFRCAPNSPIRIEHIIEQAKDVRFKVRRNNSRVVEIIQNALNGRRYANIAVPVDAWSVQGGYYWGVNNSTKTNPYQLYIHYSCSAMTLTRAKRSTADVKEKKSVSPVNITFFLVACCVTTMLVFLGISYHGKKTNLL